MSRQSWSHRPPTLFGRPGGICVPLRAQFERRMDDDENKVAGKQEEKAPEGGQAAKTKAE